MTDYKWVWEETLCLEPLKAVIFFPKSRCNYVFWIKKKKNSGPNKLQANLNLLSMTKLQHMVTTSSARQNVAFGLVGVLSEIFVA